MSPAAFVSPVFFLFLTISFHLSASQSEVVDSTGDGKGGPCPVTHDGNMTCPVNCFQYEPVCGDNGVTYGCGCPDAACAGVRVAMIGACKVCKGKCDLRSSFSGFQSSQPDDAAQTDHSAGGN